MLRLAKLTSAFAVIAQSLDDDLLHGLPVDDACHSDGQAGCALKLLQVRAHEMATPQEELVADAADDPATAPSMLGAKDMEQLLELGESEAAADAAGAGMWTQTTWESILFEMQANLTAAGKCDRDTTGTCKYGSCAKSRGPAECHVGKCLCQQGFCASEGRCYPIVADECPKETGGTCSVLSCSGSRGAAKCEKGQCLCQHGGCAWNGKCFPVTDTGGTCSALPCSESRGPTTCHKGRCLCVAGFVAKNGACERQMWG